MFLPSLSLQGLINRMVSVSCRLFFVLLVYHYFVGVTLTISALFADPSASVSIDTSNRILNASGGIVFYGKNLRERGAVDSTNKEANETVTEQLVIVGQALNLFTIDKIVSEHFSCATKVIVKLHPLHLKFGQQAFSIQLFADPKILTLMTSKRVLGAISSAFYIDCFKTSEVSLSTPGLLVMDMDSTIIDMECIDEIARLVGVGDKVAA